MLNRFGINAVVLLVGSYKLYKANLVVIVEGRDEPVLVPGYVENDPFVAHIVCSLELGDDSLRCRIAFSFYLTVPISEIRLGIGVLSPE